MRWLRAFLPPLIFLSLFTISPAQVWVLTHRGDPSGGSVVDSIGSESVVNGAANYSVLSQWSLDTEPKELNHLELANCEMQTVSIKSDLTEVVGKGKGPEGKEEWLVYNFERMAKENRITVLSPAPGFDIIDARYVDDKITMLLKKGDKQFECYQATDDGKFNRIFSTSTGDLSALKGFPHASLAVAAMNIAGKLPFVDITRSSPKTHFVLWCARL